MRQKLRLPLALVIASALVLAPAAFAQQTDSPPIEQEMSTGEFKAAGLDKLSADELANLNRWLDRKVESATAAVTEQAREQGRQEVVEKNRGFISFGSDEPITGTVTSEFRGFGKGRRYTLDNGQVWEQIDTASLVGARNPNPKVSIKPGVIGNTWYMSVEGYNTRAKVKRVE